MICSALCFLPFIESLLAHQGQLDSHNTWTSFWGAFQDHVHLAIRLSRTITIANLVQELKTASSKWVKTHSPDRAAFSWQRGYGCFSVGPSDLDSLRAYIDDQEKHHSARTFQDEFRMFLKKYGVQYDEAYVWD